MQAADVPSSVSVATIKARELAHTLCTESTTAWLGFVRPCDSQLALGGGNLAVEAQYAALCDEFSDVFAEPGLPPTRPLEHAIDLVDESAPPPKHR